MIFYHLAKYYYNYQSKIKIIFKFAGNKTILYLNPDNMKTGIQIGLAVLIVVLTFALFRSIQKPIRFEKQKAIRYEAVIQNLKDIRTAQIAYKDVNEVFTGSFDTLLNFVKHDSFPMVKKEGSVPEEMLDTFSIKRAEQIALQRGIIKRDTIKVGVLDSLFEANYPIDSLRFIPFGRGTEFGLGAGVVETGSKVKVQVFEATAENFVILNGLDRQLIINLNDGKDFPGLKVGSLVEATNNAGNWE
jgi:hypothetical protein